MAVCLIMTGCLHAAAAAEGSADQLSSRLDAAFASGRATLREIPLAGLTIRQIERITGINRGVIYRATKT